jgi:hypothetical protein
MLRRYATYKLPFEHINGKIAPWYYCCSFQQNSDENGNAYYYGYRSRSGVSKYAFRKKCRNLSLHPVTTKEEEQRQMFINTAYEVALHFHEKPAALLREFAAQNRYPTLYGYAFRRTYDNDGGWPWD